MLRAVIFLLLISFQLNATDKGLVVLVPGTFNSVMPGSHIFDGPYYSEDALQALQKNGYQTTIIQELNPFGNFEDNGKIVAAQIQALEIYHKPITIISHSAGGFYTLAAIPFLKNIFIQKVIMISTPLEGDRIADRVYNDPVFKTFFKNLLDSFSENILDLSGFEELTTVNVKAFLSKVKVSDFTEFISVAGAQETPNFWGANDTKFLSPALTASGIYLEADHSDGLVSVDSALGRGVLLTTFSGRFKKFKTYPKIYPLDHVEQFLDYRYFKWLGFRDTNYIRQEQQRFYSEVTQF